MNKEQLIQIALKHSCGGLEFDEDGLVKFAQAIRNEALEEAAQKAFSWNTAMTDVLAEEIRNLKEQQ